jgi:hypothetical protein
MLALALALWSPADAHDNERSPRIDALRNDAMQHYHADDAAGFVQRMEVVAAASRGEIDLYNLACGYALTGQTDLAIATLRKLIDGRGASFDLQDDSDFDSLRALPAFNELVGLSAYYEEVNERLEPVRDQAMDYYSEGQYALFVQIMERVTAYSHNDKDVYNLACGYALVGRTEDALSQLEILAEHGPGADYGVADDSDFRSLRGNPRFQAVLARLRG